MKQFGKFLGYTSFIIVMIVIVFFVDDIRWSLVLILLSLYGIYLNLSDLSMFVYKKEGHNMASAWKYIDDKESDHK